VLDEPTAYLDEAGALAAAAALERLARGRTALLIAHHPAVSAIADRVCRLQDGRVAEDPVRAPAPLPAAVLADGMAA
jgi:ATP-binding cassette subfamily C protein CydCD